MSNFGIGKANWVLTGWNALHKATLTAGVGVDYEQLENPELRNCDIVDSRQYQALVEPLTQLLYPAFESPSIRAEPTRILVWKKLRSIGRRDYPNLWNLLADSTHRVDPSQEYHWMQANQQDTLASLKPLPPVLAARHGYRLIWQKNHTYLDHIPRLIWGLALIGWSARHWDKPGVCEICFRCTYPGNRFCDEHTQRVQNEEKRSEAYNRYRLGKKVHALAGQRGQLNFLRGNKILRDVRRQLTFSDVLFEWDEEADAINSEMELLQHSLAASPRVVNKIGRAALGETFETLTEILREKIDPHRWDSMLWSLVVLQAEVWFALEEELSPGKRGCGKIADQRIAQAAEMLSNGMQKREIAHELGISASAISKWISRGRLVT